MSFADHLDQHRQPDGTVDLVAVEADHAAALASDPDLIDAMILKAAKQDRRAWESSNRACLRKQWDQPALSPDLDLDKQVPIGDDTVINYGAMNLDRIRVRKDLRTRKHLDEVDSFQAEMRHWFDTEAGLPPGSTIGDAIP